MAGFPYDNRDTWGIIFIKLLKNLAGIADGSITINFTPGAGSAPTAAADAVIAVTGDAVLAIPGGSKGYLVADQDNGALMYAGDASVGNGASPRGWIMSPLGSTPILTGPVYVNGTAGDIAGVILV